MTAPPPPTTQVTAPGNGALVSGTVTVSATATPAAATTLSSLAIAIDGAQVQSGASSPQSYSWNTTTLAVGSTHTIVSTATDGDGGTASSLVVTVTIGKADQSITFTSTPPANAVFGGPRYTVTATASSALPVTFSIDASATSVCSISGSTVSFTGVGTCVVDANQGGNGSYNPAPQAQQSFAAGNAASFTTLTSSVNPSVYGQIVTFTATVAAQAPGSGSPGGTVNFTDTVSSSGTECPGVVLTTGAASCTVPLLSVGTDTVNAIYSGDSHFAGSTSAALAQVVNMAASTTALTSSLNPSGFGQPATYTATVAAKAPGEGKPTGSVSFFDGTPLMGNSTLSNGVATFSTSSLSGGSHSITASCGGSANFTGSTSAALTQVVNKAATKLVAAPANRFFPTFKATLTGASDGHAVAGRTVVFSVSGQPLCSATTDTSGIATCSVFGFVLGPSSYAAHFGGDANYLPSQRHGPPQLNPPGLSLDPSRISAAEPS